MEPTASVVVPMALIQLVTAFFTVVLWWFAFIKRPHVKPLLFLAIVTLLPALGAVLFSAGTSTVLSDLLGFTSASGFVKALSDLLVLSQVLTAVGMLWLVIWILAHTQQQA